ncbi:kinase-like protein [Heliocybe sulcata]|uniref:Kinase-like protein n=1 Tax=Heliocybe sulcata TaxID=5364 RepID=A0A5C3NGP6_9AGAM|nr:kinase-like protein [Heliocybe sulcata]
MQPASHLTAIYQKEARGVDLRCTVLGTYKLSLLQHRDPDDMKEFLYDLVMDASVPIEILALNNTKIVRGFLNVLQKALDTLRSQSNHSDVRMLLSRTEEILRHVSYKADILPSILFVRDIEVIGMHPVTGGGWSDVWKGTLRGQEVALKVLRDYHVIDEGRKACLRKRFRREALIWRQLRHPNIHSFLGIFEGLHNPSLVSPWRSKGHLLDFLHSPSGRKYDRAMILSEIASALAYLHLLTPPLVHGDIKAANVLVDDRNRPCLVDFGISKFVRPAAPGPPAGNQNDLRSAAAPQFRQAIECVPATMTQTSLWHGTLRWMPPEAFTGVFHGSTAGDMYSFGCLCLEVYTLEHPWREEPSEVAIITRCLAGERPVRPPQVPDEVWTIVKMVWQQDPGERQTAPWVEWLLAGISDQYPEATSVLADDQPAIRLDE